MLNNTKNCARLIGAAAAIALLGGSSATAQTPAPMPPAPIASAPPAAPAARLAAMKIPEGTEVLIRFDEKLSSGTNTDGDQFSISLAEPIKLADGSVLPAGYRGRGEISNAQKRGHMGKAGQLNVRLDYLRIGADRVRIRATKGEDGKGSVGSAVVLTVLFGPIGLLARGADVVIPKGQTMTAFIDADTDLAMPLAAPPNNEL